MVERARTLALERVRKATERNMARYDDDEAKRTVGRVIASTEMRERNTSVFTVE